MSDESRPTRSHALTCSLTVLAAVVLYIFSYGPAYALNEWIHSGKRRLPPTGLHSCYQPVRWLSNQTGLGPLLRAERNWCLELTRKDRTPPVPWVSTRIAHHT